MTSSRTVGFLVTAAAAADGLRPFLFTAAGVQKPVG
jgi:hypothetical protein